MMFEGASGALSHETDREKLSCGSESATDAESAEAAPDEGAAKDRARGQ